MLKVLALRLTLQRLVARLEEPVRQEDTPIGSCERVVLHGAGPLAEDGRWVLIAKKGAAEGEAHVGEAEQLFDTFDQGIAGGDDLPEPAADGFPQ